MILVSSISLTTCSILNCCIHFLWENCISCRRLLLDFYSCFFSFWYNCHFLVVLVLRRSKLNTCCTILSMLKNLIKENGVKENANDSATKIRQRKVSRSGDISPKRHIAGSRRWFWCENYTLHVNQ